MGLAGAFFEPQPCNFGKLDIFSRCSNDIEGDAQKMRLVLFEISQEL